MQMEAELPEKYASAWQKVTDAQGVVIPGGFGLRGVEGMVAAARVCRRDKKPFLGICLGMQACPLCHLTICVFCCCCLRLASASATLSMQAAVIEHACSAATRAATNARAHVPGISHRRPHTYR